MAEAKYDHRAHMFGTVEGNHNWDVASCAGTVPPALVSFDRSGRAVTVEVFAADVNVDDWVILKPVATTEHMLREEDRDLERPTDDMVGFYAGAAIASLEVSQ